MKLTKLYPSQQELPIVDANGQPTDVVFQVVGEDSTQYREATKRANQIMHGKKGTPEELDAILKADADLVASCIVGWRGLENDDGTPIPYSPTKALELMGKPELIFIAKQVGAFTGERKHFFRKGDAAA